MQLFRPGGIGLIKRYDSVKLLDSKFTRSYYPINGGGPCLISSFKPSFSIFNRAAGGVSKIGNSIDCSNGYLSRSTFTALILRHTYMAAMATADACDSNASLLASGDLRVLQPIFKVYGQCRAFSGPIVTLKVFEDNVLVRELLESRGEGRILVIDGGGSMRCALVGGNLGQLAQNMGWSGIVVNGCIRDVDEINGCDIGVRALASHPLKSSKKGIGEKHVPVYVGGALIRDGEWLYADGDGILVSKTELCI